MKPQLLPLLALALLGFGLSGSGDASAAHQNPRVLEVIPVRSADITALAVDSVTGLLYGASSPDVQGNGFAGIVVVDPASQEEVARVPLSPAYHFLDIAIDSSTGRAYTVDTFTTTLFTVDTRKNRLTAETDSPGVVGPYNVSVDDRRDRVYWTESDQITVIDSSTDKVIDTFPLRLGNIAVSAADHNLYGTSAGELLVVDELTGRQEHSIKITGGLGVSVNSVTNQIYVTMPAVDGLAIVDGSTNAVIDTRGFLGGDFSKVGINESTNTLYISSGRNLEVVDGMTNETITTVPDAGGLVAVDPVRDRVYTTFGGGISVIGDGAGLPPSGGPPASSNSTRGLPALAGLALMIGGLASLAIGARRAV
jgi:DNA-binding beta-propeller fold protein YncE